MPLRTIRRAAASDSDDSSSSDDDRGRRGGAALVAERYAAADIAGGLASREFRVRALQELHALISGGAYARSPKPLQAAVFEDLLIAARLRDSRQAVRAAQAAALDAAKRALPQQRRAQLLTEQRRAGVAAHRERRRRREGEGGGEGDGSGSEEEEEGQEPELTDVPDEVVRIILSSLDPVSLGRAACACRAWRGMVAADATLWTEAVGRVFGRRGKAAVAAAAAAAAATTGIGSEGQAAGGGGERGARAERGAAGAEARAQAAAGALSGADAANIFRSLCADHPSCLVPWRACRVLSDGCLRWVVPGCNNSSSGGGSSGGPKQPAPAATKQQRRQPQRQLRRGQQRVAYPTAAQAVAWMCGGDGDISSDSSDGDSLSSEGSTGSEEEGAEAEAARGVTRRLRLWALPSPG